MISQICLGEVLKLDFDSFFNSLAGSYELVIFFGVVSI